ncbi:MAG: hypothetical protein WC916_02715 [Candidatus Woesearchaeota archaeon]
MVDVSYEKEFVFHDGRRAKSLSELYRSICTLSDDACYVFVTAEKNDFANWIEFILCDYELATKVRNVRSREEITSILEQQLREFVAQESFVRITKKEFALLSPIITSASESAVPPSAVQVSTPAPSMAPSISSISTSAPLKVKPNPANNKWYDFFIKREPSEKETPPLKKDAEKTAAVVSIYSTSTTSSTTPLSSVSSFFLPTSSSSPLLRPTARSLPIFAATKPSKNNWYEFFVRKKSSELALDTVKANAAAGPTKEDSVADASVLPHPKPVDHVERIFWVTLYTVLIITVVGLLVYILFFKNY